MAGQAQPALTADRVSAMAAQQRGELERQGQHLGRAGDLGRDPGVVQPEVVAGQQVQPLPIGSGVDMGHGVPDAILAGSRSSRGHRGHGLGQVP